MLTYWEAVKAACFWAHQYGCAYVVARPEGTFFVIHGDNADTLHYPDNRVCLRVGR